MRGRCRIALALLLVLTTVFVSCRKGSNTSQAPLPWQPTDSIPGNDTIPTPKYNQVAVPETINDNVGGYYEALPPSYAEEKDKRFPLLVFLHGGGELGNGKSDLPL